MSVIYSRENSLSLKESDNPSQAISINTLTSFYQKDASSGNYQGSTINCNELHNKIKFLMKDKKKGERVDEAQEDNRQLGERLNEAFNHHQEVSFKDKFSNLNNLTFSNIIII